MKYVWIVAGLVVAIALALWLWPAPITNYPSSGTDIVAFGDSLIEGVGATASNTLPELLSQRIGQPVINLGRSGDTTETALARIDELDAYNPKVVIVLLGGNDYLQHVPVDETFDNLATIIDSIQNKGAVVLLLGVRGGVLQDNFTRKFDELSKKYHTAYVSDVLSGLLGNREYMEDQVHPNDAGYAKIADRVAPVLEKLIK